jgi:hypothetical protein
MASGMFLKISRSDLKIDSTTRLAVIEDVKHLSSYNWIEAPKTKPTIAVPGTPALWSPPTRARTVKKDSGLRYINQNAARHPDSPLEPLFRALYLTYPAVDISLIDIVTDRNNIRKLLCFINPRGNKHERESFTMKIEVVGNTAIVQRDEAATTEFVAPHEFKGYGHEFETTYTIPQIKGSTGHHRIISYRFGGMNFMIRHETDGYVEANPKSSQVIVKSETSEAESEDKMFELMGSLSLSAAGSSNTGVHSATNTSEYSDSTSDGNHQSTGTAKTKTTGSPELTGLQILEQPLDIDPERGGTTDKPHMSRSKLKVIEDGEVVLRESTLEIKTRTAKKPLIFEEIAAQLWVSQTPKLVRAHHYQGKFQVPKVEDVEESLKNWEQRNQDDLKLLPVLIRKIIGAVNDCGGRAILKYHFANDQLEIGTYDGKRLLPAELYAKWGEEVEHNED